MSVVTREIEPHDTYRHEALFWRGPGEFLDAVVPFVLDGVEAGQPVMVAVIAPRIALLREALGSAAAPVRFFDMTRLGHNPALIIAAWKSFVDECAVDGHPVRGVGEPIWSGRREAELVECQLHEAALNVAIGASVPIWLLCPYDLDSLDPSVIDESRHSHPALVRGAQWVDSPSYGGTDHLEELFAARLPEPEVPVATWSFGEHDLCLLRSTVAEFVRSCGVREENCDDLVFAVHEVASNSVVHGGGSGVLRWWADADSVVLEVRDRGRITDPLVGRSAPSLHEAGGRGMWLVNQLCDLVQVRSGDRGTAVRVHHWR